MGSSTTPRFYAFLSIVSCFYTLVSRYTTLCNLSADIGHVIQRKLGQSSVSGGNLGDKSADGYLLGFTDTF